MSPQWTKQPQGCINQETLNNHVMKLIFAQHDTCFYVSDNNGKPMYIRQGGDDRAHNGGFTTYATLGNLIKAAQRFEQKVGYAPTKG